MTLISIPAEFGSTRKFFRFGDSAVSAFGVLAVLETILLDSCFGVGTLDVPASEPDCESLE